MKKLKLNLANMPNTEVLTREQLKKVMGGYDEIGSEKPTCAPSSCGAMQLPCCSSRDHCSDASSKGVCVSRP